MMENFLLGAVVGLVLIIVAVIAFAAWIEATEKPEDKNRLW